MFKVATVSEEGLYEVPGLKVLSLKVEGFVSTAPPGYLHRSIAVLLGAYTIEIHYHP
jgi:hypothetical protein